MRDGKTCIGFYEAGNSPAIEKLAHGFSSLGYDFELRDIGGFKSRDAEKYFDFVVLHGLRWKFREAYEHFRSINKSVIILDFGYLDRVCDRPDYFDKHWYLGFDGFGWRPKWDCDSSRFKKLKVKISYEGRNPQNTIVVFGQMPRDASHNLDEGSLIKKYHEIINELKLKSDGKYKILFRPHPRAPEFGPRNIEFQNIELKECLNTAHCIVTINSNSGIDAIINGCPVICEDSAHYREFVNGFDCNLDNLVVPSLPIVKQLCNQLSYAQWTLAECEKGLPAKFFMENNLIPPPG